jgi:hypothetical protein
MQCYKKMGQGLTCPIQHYTVNFVYFNLAFKNTSVFAYASLVASLL